ncbi:MAG: transposase [Syntrophomonadaceae bacterium]
MSRKPRSLSSTGIYHIMLRGNERKPVFADDQDKRKFIKIIDIKRCELNFSLYAYCLMDNHVHLLIDTKEHHISVIMRGVATRYATYYNWKHDRVGHVFQDRYKSEPVENERYLLAVVRYIHNNPVQAGLANTPEDYEWSSYLAYLSNSAHVPYINRHVVLRLFSDKEESAITQFMAFSMKAKDEDGFNFIEDDGQMIKTLAEGRILLDRYLAEKGLLANNFQRDVRDDLIRYLSGRTSLSQSTIAQLIGINRKTVMRVLQEK